MDTQEDCIVGAGGPYAHKTRQVRCTGDRSRHRTQALGPLDVARGPVVEETIIINKRDPGHGPAQPICPSRLCPFVTR